MRRPEYHQCGNRLRRPNETKNAIHERRHRSPNGYSPRQSQIRAHFIESYPDGLRGLDLSTREDTARARLASRHCLFERYRNSGRRPWPLPLVGASAIV